MQKRLSKLFSNTDRRSIWIITWSIMPVFLPFGLFRINTTAPQPPPWRWVCPYEVCNFLDKFVKQLDAQDGERDLGYLYNSCLLIPNCLPTWSLHNSSLVFNGLSFLLDANINVTEHMLTLQQLSRLFGSLQKLLSTPAVCLRSKQ